MNALVLGGAGFLGMHVVQALVDGGHTVVAGHRKRTNTMILRKRKVARCLADTDERESLVKAMTGQDLVVHAAAFYPRFSVDHETVLKRGIAQSQRVLDAAAEAGVRRLIYLSSTATVAPAASGPSTEAHVFSEPPGFGLYHDLKWHMEQLFLAEDRLEVVVLCPSACLGAWDMRVGTSAILVGTARGLQPKHPDGIVNIVDASDVGRAVLSAALMENPPKRVILSGTNTQLHALLIDLSRRYQVPPPTAPLSAADAEIQADLAEAEAMKNGGRAEMVREIVDLVNHGIPIQATLAETALGMTWTPLEKTLDTFDVFARKMGFIPTLKTEHKATFGQRW